MESEDACLLAAWQKAELAGVYGVLIPSKRTSTSPTPSLPDSRSSTLAALQPSWLTEGKIGPSNANQILALTIDLLKYHAGLKAGATQGLPVRRTQ